MSTLADSYRERRVFVTGHTGFKGAWLAEWLGTLGAQVTGYALDPPTEPSLFEAIGLGARLRHVVADVRDRDRLAVEVEAAQPSVIFHLAAQAIVRRAYAEPHETFETNVMGTVNVLEAARACRFGSSGRHRHQRQVLPEPRDGPGLPRDGCDGRPRPLQRQQGLRGACHGRLP